MVKRMVDFFRKIKNELEADEVVFVGGIGATLDSIWFPHKDDICNYGSVEQARDTLKAALNSINSRLQQFNLDADWAYKKAKEEYENTPRLSAVYNFYWENPWNKIITEYMNVASVINFFLEKVDKLEQGSRVENQNQFSYKVTIGKNGYTLGLFESPNLYLKVLKHQDSIYALRRANKF